MSEQAPRVSVLLPVSRATLHLAAAIESVLGQTLQDLELLIVVDDADGGSLQIAQSYAARDRRLRLLPWHTPTDPDLCLGPMCEALLATAQGEFVAWQLATDVSDSTRLARQLAYLGDHPEIDAVGSGIVLTDAALLPEERRFVVPRPDPKALSPDIVAASLMLRRLAAAGAGPMRFADAAGGPDHDWLLRLCERHVVGNVTDCLYHSRRTGRLHTHDDAPSMRAEVLARYAALERRAGRPDPLAGIAPGRLSEMLADRALIEAREPQSADRLAALAHRMPHTWPLVSVLMPFRNHHRELHEALATLTVQSFMNFEVVIFDNGSSPMLHAEDVNLANYSFPVRLSGVRQPIRGYRVCQALVEAARGSFLLWHRPDTASRNDRIEVLLKYLLEHPDCNAVGSGYNWAGQSLTDIIHSVAYRAQAFDGETFDGLPHAFMLRRTAIESAGPYRATDWFPLETGSYLARITPRSSVHNFFGFMLQAYPDRPQSDDPRLWADWIAHGDSQKGWQVSKLGWRMKESGAEAARHIGQAALRFGAALKDHLAPSAFNRDIVQPLAAPALHKRAVTVRLVASSPGAEEAVDRLLPGGTRRWGNVEFVFADAPHADYHVFLNNPPHPYPLSAPPNRVWFAVGEPPTETHRALHRGAGRGTVVLTCDPQFTGSSIAEPRRYIAAPCMTPTWSVQRTHDEIAHGLPPEKSRQLSWVTSGTTIMAGHRYRMQFLDRIRSAVPIDVFGRGLTPIDDKWDGLAPYRCSIGFENFSGPTYFSEKLMDCFVAETLPLYYGCTQIKRYFPEQAIWALDPEDSRIVERIREVIEGNQWVERLPAIREAKHAVLTRHNMFITIAEFISRDTERPLPVREMIINPVIVDFRGA